MKTPILSILASAAAVCAAAGDGDWAAAYTKAEAALAQLTEAEKIKLVTGVGWEKGPCVGNIAALSSIPVIVSSGFTFRVRHDKNFRTWLC
jgi:beta-glucosidase